MAKHGVVCVTRALDIMAVEDLRDQGGRGSLRVWEANAEDLRGALDWHEIQF